MNVLSEVSPLKYSEKELLSFLLYQAQQGQTPLALWREPGSVSRHVVISNQYRQLETSTPLEDLEAGFLMAPFEKNKGRIFLPADMLFTFQDGHLKKNAGVMQDNSIQWLTERLQAGLPERKFIPASSSAALPDDVKRESFLETVQKGIAEIARGTFEKIVPSRTITVTLPDTFDVTTSFQKLCDNYPGALISFVTIPGVGSWLGASPELLVCVQDKTIFKTVALAGTLPFRPDLDIKNVAWTQKEIEEQALVERYVISCFKKIRLREYEEHGPKTVIAGNLVHLKSEFTVDIKATDFPQLGSVMLDLLHPTSAVCGMPLEPALHFLKTNEKHDRRFYAGYLGPVNIESSISLFVNLRCMELRGKHGVLYAGAGVTIDSAPDKEWQETEIKFNTLLNVIL
jgi:isochorismate synthase